jgi:Flp pilus assembly protein TadD
MQNIAKQTDDPEILGAGKAAIDFNLQGIRCYRAGKLGEAQDLFRQGLALQPKNISIALNMAQSLLHMGVKNLDAASLAECQNSLKLVGKMPETDPRFERFQKLRIRAFGE